MRGSRSRKRRRREAPTQGARTPRARRLRAKHCLAGGSGILPEPGRGAIRRMGEGHLRRLRRSAIRAHPAIGGPRAGSSHTKTRRHEGLCGAGVVHNPPHNAHSREVGKRFLAGGIYEPESEPKVERARSANVRQGRKRRLSRSWPKGSCTRARAYVRESEPQAETARSANPGSANALRTAFEGREQENAK